MIAIASSFTFCFPYFKKTYNVDRQVPDSAATATAFLCGVKVNYETVGVDSVVPLRDCEASKNPNSHLNSVLQWAQDANKATGEVGRKLLQLKLLH